MQQSRHQVFSLELDDRSAKDSYRLSSEATFNTDTLHSTPVGGWIEAKLGTSGPRTSFRSG